MKRKRKARTRGPPTRIPPLARVPPPPRVPPDFVLAPVRGLDPVVLMPGADDAPETASMKKLVLMLALIYNDLKSVSWASYQLGTIPPDSGRADPVIGQIIGMKDTFERMACGILSELGKVIRHHSQVLNLPAVRQSIASLAPGHRDAWEDLVDLAHERNPRRKLREFYREIRDGLAFHYDVRQDLLSDGYVSHFTASDRHPARGRAFVSLGRNMEESRFFFADAASTAVRADLMGRHGVNPDTLIKFLKNANMALRFVIEAMLQVLESRAPQAPKLGSR